MDVRWQSVWLKTKPLKHLTYCYPLVLCAIVSMQLPSSLPPVLVPPPGSKYFHLMSMSDTHFLFF